MRKKPRREISYDDERPSKPRKRELSYEDELQIRQFALDHAIDHSRVSTNATGEKIDTLKQAKKYYDFIRYLKVK